MSALAAAVSAALALLLSGCASHAPREAPVFFPPAPSKPKIQYLTSYSGNSDIVARNAFREFLMGRPAEDSLVKPYGMAIANNKLYVCDTVTALIRVFDFEKGRFGIFIPTGGNVLKKPLNISIDRDGTMYVTDTVNEQVLIFGANGESRGIIGRPGEMRPGDVAIGTDKLYISDMSNRCVRVYDKKTLEPGGIIPPTRDNRDHSLFSPVNVALDPAGNVYVSDLGAFRIQKYDSNGKYLASVGRHGDNPGEFARPKGIAVDKEGRLYVVDAASQTVQMFDSEGKLLMFFGDVGGSPYPLNLPAKVIVDYDHVPLFKKFCADNFEIEHLILVTSQYGPRKVQVYGFGHEVDTNVVVVVAPPPAPVEKAAEEAMVEPPARAQEDKAVEPATEKAPETPQVAKVEAPVAAAAPEPEQEKVAPPAKPAVAEEPAVEAVPEEMPEAEVAGGEPAAESVQKSAAQEVAVVEPAPTSRDPVTASEPAKIAPEPVPEPAEVVAQVEKAPEPVAPRGEPAPEAKTPAKKPAVAPVPVVVAAEPPKKPMAPRPARAAELGAEDIKRLFDLVKKGDNKAVKSMIARYGKTAATCRGEAGITPLHMAAAVDNSDIAKELIKAGADVDARSAAGSTPLHWAVKGDAASAVKILLSNGASLNATDNAGLTPAMLADKLDRPRLKKLLRTP